MSDAKWMPRGELVLGLVLGVLALAGILLPDLLAARRVELAASEAKAAPAGDDAFYEAEPPPEIPAEKRKDITSFSYWKTVRAKVTAYTPGPESCGESADGVTSTGKDAWLIDGVAAAPGAVPYGSLVFLPGVGYRLVDDTGRAMRESWVEDGLVHIDLRFASVAEARRWGVQELNVDIYLSAANH